MRRFNRKHTPITWSNPAYGTKDLSPEVWAPIAPTVHWASGSRLRHRTSLCGIIPPFFWHGIRLLLGCQHSPPSFVVGSATLHHPLFFASLRFSLARRQCPLLGTKYWTEQHKRSLFSHSRPTFPSRQNGPTPTWIGYFLCLLNARSARISFVIWMFTTENEGNSCRLSWSNSERPCYWYMLTAMCIILSELFRGDTDCGLKTSFHRDILKTQQPFSLSLSVSENTSGCKQKKRNVL